MPAPEDRPLLAHLVTLQSKLLEQEAALAERERALAAATRAQDGLRAQVTGLEEELARIRASKAWRMTGPARRLGARLKGAK